jgi:hypothetical protein
MVGEERKRVKEKEGNSTHHHHKVACLLLFMDTDRKISMVKGRLVRDINKELR